MGGLSFSMKDVYGEGALSTMENTIPESSDKDAFEENSEVREKVSANTSGGVSGKSIIFAMGAIVLMAFIMGSF